MTSQNMKTNTRLTTLGRNPHKHQGIVNPPVYHASTILFKDYAEYKASRRDGYLNASYARYGTESVVAFARALADLEGAAGAFITSTGMSALTTALLAVLSSGDHILVTDTVYDPTRKLCENEFKRLGVETTYFDPMIGADIEKLFKPNTKVVFLECPGSLTFEVQDIPAISAIAHKHDAVVMIDNTWAAPLLNKPFELGVDISIYAATKYIAGHSDLMMGVISANEKWLPVVEKTFKNTGPCPGPDDVYLAQRGLRTLSTRMRQHQLAGLEIANWLKTVPEVVRVLHPALPDCPGHENWKRDFIGSNGLFGFVIKPCSEEAIAAFVDGLHHFGMGYSWGGYESLILRLWLDSIRSVCEYKDGIYFRIHIGLEDVEDLKHDLEEGFKRMRSFA
jgi:cysteine-S-conjugate beta-lyase